MVSICPAFCPAILANFQSFGCRLGGEIGEIRKLNFFWPDSYSPWNLGPDKPLRVEFRAQFERKKPFPRSFAKLGTIYLVKFIIFMTARLPIQNLESFRAQTEKLKFEQSRGPGFEPTRGRQFFFQLLAFFAAFYLFGGHFEHSHDLRVGYGRLYRPKTSNFCLYRVPIYVEIRPDRFLAIWECFYRQKWKF